MTRRRRNHKPGQVPIAERKKAWYIESHKVKKIDDYKEDACEDKDRDLPVFEEFKGQRERDLERFQRQCPLLDLANALELLSEYPLAEAIKKGKERTMAPKGYIAKWIKRELEDPLDQTFWFADKRDRALKKSEEKKRQKLKKQGEVYFPPILRITEIRKSMEQAQVPLLFKTAYAPVKWLARDLKPYLLDLKKSAAVKMGLAILAQLPEDEEEDAGQAGAKHKLPRVEDENTLAKKKSASFTMRSLATVVTRLATRNGHALGQAPAPLAIALPAPTVAASQPAHSTTVGTTVETRSAKRECLKQAPPPTVIALPAPIVVAPQPARSTAGTEQVPPPTVIALPAPIAVAPQPARSTTGTEQAPPPTVIALPAPIVVAPQPARSTTGSKQGPPPTVIALPAPTAVAPQPARSTTGTEQAPPPTVIALPAPTVAPLKARSSNGRFVSVGTLLANGIKQAPSPATIAIQSPTAASGPARSANGRFVSVGTILANRNGAPTAAAPLPARSSNGRFVSVNKSG